MKSRWMLAVAVACMLAAWYLARSIDPKPTSASAPHAKPASIVVPDLATKSPQAPPVESVTPRTAPVLAESTPPATAAAPPVDPAPAGVLLYGFVRPIAGSERLDLPVTVALMDRLAERRLSTAGPEGEYSFPNVASGRYWIIAQSHVVGETRKVVDVDAASGDRRLDLQLEAPQEILVEVVDPGGEMVRGVALIAVATSESPDEWLDVLFGAPQTNFGVGIWTENGNADTNYPAPVYGRLRLSMPPPVFVSIVHGQRVIATQRVEPGEPSVRFALDPQATLMKKGSLRFRLIDAETRQPLAGMGLLMNQQLENARGSTGPDGTFSRAGLPGWLGVKMWGAKIEALDLVVRIEPGVETDLGDIPLGAPISISGMVVDEQGQGVATTLSYDVIESTTGRTIAQLVRYSAKSSTDGSFRIGGLSRHRYRLRVDDRESAFGIQVLEVDTRAGSVDGVHVGLARGIPLLLSASDERWALVRFDLFNDQGMLLRSGRLYGPEPQKILLAPGRYEMEVRVGGVSENGRRTITIANDPVELSLP